MCSSPSSSNLKSAEASESNDAAIAIAEFDADGLGVGADGAALPPQPLRQRADTDSVSFERNLNPS